jgi:hypothetical protein
VSVHCAVLCVHVGHLKEPIRACNFKFPSYIDTPTCPTSPLRCDACSCTAAVRCTRDVSGLSHYDERAPMTVLVLMCTRGTRPVLAPWSCEVALETCSQTLMLLSCHSSYQPTSCFFQSHPCLHWWLPDFADAPDRLYVRTEFPTFRHCIETRRCYGMRRKINANMPPQQRLPNYLLVTTLSRSC